MNLQCICLAAGLALTPLTLADELHVPSQYPTIQAALDASQSGDEVVVADGLYSGEGNQDLGMPSHTLTLRSASGDPALCIVQVEEVGGEEGSRAIYPSSASIIRGITFRGGSGAYLGGAMLTSSSPRFERCVFSGNSTSGWWDPPSEEARGGAIYLSGSSATFDRCVFSGNSARIMPVFGMGSGAGGAIYISGGAPVFLDCEFRSNSAQGNDAGSGSGGGLYITNGADVRIEGGTFAGNSTYWDGGGGAGGAIRVGDSSLLVSDVVFERNAAHAAWGGVGGALFVSSGAVVQLHNCRLVDNQATGSYMGSESRGGAMSIFNSSVTVTNSLLAENEVLGDVGTYGGAINLAGAASLLVRSATIVGNRAEVGGAVFLDSGDPAFDVAGAIVYGNGAGAIAGTGVISITYSDVEAGWPGAGNIDADPMLLDPGAGDYSLGSGSPCVDAGDNTAVPTGILTDLAGLPRFVDDPAAPDTGVPGGAGGSAIVDMGALERQVAVCYPDCDGNGALDFFDFLCFQDAFA
ncbi:MAG: right-handed parallel beta-helix repeat-containing protein, partial [Phycisphaerales bacterium JB039]